MQSSLELKSIADSGGGVSVDGAYYSSLELKSVAASGQASGAALIIRNAGKFTSLEMKNIASSSPGNVTFVI